jgi:hypothetical protein
MELSPILGLTGLEIKYRADIILVEVELETDHYDRFPMDKVN